MQRILSLKLFQKSSKPRFNLLCGNHRFCCMMDTGADMPVWCGMQELFNLVFPDAELCKEKFILGGFGKGYDFVDIYKVPRFVIASKGDYILFKDLYVAVSFDRSFGCDLILSATMFDHMDYAICHINLNIPELRITYINTVFRTKLCTSQYNNSIASTISSSVESDEVRDTAGAFRELYKTKRVDSF